MDCTLEILNSINLIRGVSDVGALDNEEGGTHLNAGVPPPSATFLFVFAIFD